MLALFLHAMLLTNVGALSGIDEHPTGDADFDYYFGEFTNYEMKVSDPMAKLIANRLAESIFATSDEKVFKSRIQLLLNARNDYPTKLDRFLNLDSILNAQFDIRVKEAKHKRLLYTEIGAVVGAVVAIPVGLVIGQKFTSMGAKALLIAVPIGALSGAGAGFLLGELLAMPHFDYQQGIFSKDLKAIEDEIGQIN